MLVGSPYYDVIYYLNFPNLVSCVTKLTYSLASVIRFLGVRVCTTVSLPYMHMCSYKCVYIYNFHSSRYFIVLKFSSFPISYTCSF